MKISRKLDKAIAEIFEKREIESGEVDDFAIDSDGSFLSLNINGERHIVWAWHRTISIDGEPFSYPLFSRIKIVLGYGCIGRFLAWWKKSRAIRARQVEIARKITSLLGK